MYNRKYINKLNKKYKLNIQFGDGDWGLGIGPNPQSPIPNPHIFNVNIIFN